MHEFFSRSPLETKQIAEQIAETMTFGEVYILTGEMGTGKTVFVQGVAEYFSCRDTIASPTFGIVNCYEGIVQGALLHLFHFDLFRVQSMREFLDFGFDEYFEVKNGISFIEWGERFREGLPVRAKQILFTVGVDNESHRDIVLTMASQK